MQLSRSTLTLIAGLLDQVTLRVAGDDFEDQALAYATAKREVRAALDAPDDGVPACC